MARGGKLFLPGPQVNDGGAVAAEGFRGQGKGKHHRQARENGVDAAPQMADTFAMHDAHFEQAALAAGVEVGGDEFLEVARVKGVQVEFARDGERDGFITGRHGGIGVHAGGEISTGQGTWASGQCAAARWGRGRGRGEFVRVFERPGRYKSGMSLLHEIEPLKQTALGEFQAAAELAALEQAKGAWLGPQGRFTALMKQLGTLPKEEKPAAGKLINAAKIELEAALAARREELELKAALATEPTDFTLPGRRRPLGKLHPLTQVTDDIVRAFRKIGFVVADGPEIEDDYHCFDSLNTPADHPARDAQDTFYVGSTATSFSPLSWGRGPG